MRTQRPESEPCPALSSAERVPRLTQNLAEVRDKLRLLKKELGFANYNALLNYMALELTKGEAIPPASYAQVFRDNRPVVS
jgi:hypothetical protein